MALAFAVERDSGRVTVRINGRLTLGPQLRMFGEQITLCIASERPSAILLDVQAVTEVDSAGLGELMILYTTAGEYGSRVGLLWPSERFVRLLQITNLVGLLPQFESMSDAEGWLSES